MDVILAYLANQTGICRREVAARTIKLRESNGLARGVHKSGWAEKWFKLFTGENCTYRYVYGERIPLLD